MSDTGQLIKIREQFFIAYNRLIQMAKIHQDNNQILVECAGNFIAMLDRLSEEEPVVTIQVINGRFYLQHEKLSYHRETAGIIQAMLQFFQSRQIEGLRFSTAVKNTPELLNQAVTFARWLHAAGRQPTPLEWLAAKLEENGITWVEIVREIEELPEEEEEISDQERRERERKKKARRTYACTLNSIKDVAERIGSKKQAGARKTVRIVQNMVDMVMVDEPVLLGLSTIRDYDDYTFSHSVNVAILAMYLGKRIGLSRESLERLGVCGLFHDLGKIEVPLDVLNKPTRLNRDELVVMQDHPLNSVRHILRLKASRELKSKIIIPPFEHHVREDLSGYPQTQRKKPMSFFGKILTIADVFDAMTTPRTYQEPYSPDRALVLMLHGSGRYFDPILLKVFVGMLGLYPVGTLLILDTGEMGLVMEPPEKTDGSLPKVQLLVADQQGRFRKSMIVNLAEVNPETGKPVRAVVKSMHPSTYNIQPAEFLLQ